MLKQKLKLKTISKLAAVALSAVVLIGGAYGLNSIARADQFDEQIQALQAQNNNNQALSNSLAAQAASYQQAVDALDEQVNAIQQNIVATQNKIDDLQNQINAAQAQLDQQKKTLGENIRAMYLEGDISTLEVLASSKNLSDYVNKQEYRNQVSDKVKASVDTIASLKAQLVSAQNTQKSLLGDLQTQHDQLSAKEAQQSSLLSYTESQKSAYDSQIRANSSKIASLRAQQAALNRQLGGVPVAGDPGRGGYPTNWNNAPQDSLIDSWGMYNRECVSYAAWKVFQTYGYMPYWGGRGNANEWPGDARSAGIPTGSTPKVGSVAIWNVGAFGHAMWVEAVNGNTIYVSQYNYDFTGHYSEMSISASGLTFIYFGDR